jgi:hypothetical protein
MITDNEVDRMVMSIKRDDRGVGRDISLGRDISRSQLDLLPVFTQRYPSDLTVCAPLYRQRAYQDDEDEQDPDAEQNRHVQAAQGSARGRLRRLSTSKRLA